MPLSPLRGREATSARYLLWLAAILVAGGLAISLLSSTSPKHFAKRERAVSWVFLGGAPAFWLLAALVWVCVCWGVVTGTQPVSW